MLNINGKVQVTNMRGISEKMLVGTIISYEKVGEEFVATFINSKFVGEALTTIMNNGIMDKDKIVIEKGILGSRAYTNKEGEVVTQLQATIFSLSPYVEDTTASDNSNKAQNRSFKR